MSAPEGEPIYLSWVAYNGRSEAMARGMGIRGVFIHAGPGLSLPVRYWKQWRQTGAMLRRIRPSAVVVMQPPFFSLLRAWMYAVGSGAKLAADMHTGAFEDPRWKWATRWILRIARGSGRRVILTNEALAKRARAAGATVVISHGYLREFEAPEIAEFDDDALTALQHEDFVLVPLAWAYDEPVSAIIDAARTTPAVRWVLTGKAPADVVASAPANVLFSGFATRPDYERLRRYATVVGAFTTAEATMQRSGYEALEATSPLVTSPMLVLEEYFGESVLYAEPNAESIADAVSLALARAPELRTGMKALLREKLEEQEAAMIELKKWLND